MAQQAHPWRYCGDVNIKEGGYFFRVHQQWEYADIVNVVPCSDAGGPNNMFWIETGTISIPRIGTTEYDELAMKIDDSAAGHYVVCTSCDMTGSHGSEFECRMIMAGRQDNLGLCSEGHEWKYVRYLVKDIKEIIQYKMGYSGLDDRGKTITMRIGKRIPHANGSWDEHEIDHVLRSNQSLEKFVRDNFLD